MTLTLNPEVEALLDHEMASGHFKDINELIETALHVLAESRPFKFGELDEIIQEGIDGIERGDVYTEDEARAYLAAMRAKL